ncbi:MAG: Lar family restriction alleviation protein [Ruminococcus sp.]|nr:Lar family restriction alleviation protein [Ruminococcus sp.]
MATGQRNCIRSYNLTPEEWDKLNNMTSKDFEHCPFCGEQKGQLMMDILHKRYGVSKNVPNHFYVECGNPNCMARGGFDLDPYKAIEKWNNRAVATSSNDDELIYGVSGSGMSYIHKGEMISQCNNNYNFDYHVLKGKMRIYDYFEKDHIIYDKDNIELLTPEILSNICAFQYTELGAEGMGGLLLMFDTNGKSYSVCYCSYSADEYSTTAYDYINKYLNLDEKVKIKMERGEWSKKADKWTTLKNGMGWYICCHDSVINKIPEINDFYQDMEGVMFYFPYFFSKEK